MNPSVSSFMTSALVAAVAAVAITGIGVLSARAATYEERRRDVGGPYRSMRLPEPPKAERSGERLVALGGALLASAAGPALILALVTLEWEGIGVTLLPALLVVAARLYASFVTFRGGDLGAARTIAHASLLLDVPLLVFSIVHVRLDDGAVRESLSLAIVSGTFALADGVQALLVLIVPSPRAVIRE